MLASALENPPSTHIIASALRTQQVAYAIPSPLAEVIKYRMPDPIPALRSLLRFDCIKMRI